VEQIEVVVFNTQGDKMTSEEAQFQSQIDSSDANTESSLLPSPSQNQRVSPGLEVN
jgi:hypothetical protein